MDVDRAVEILKWGVYAKGQKGQHPTAKEKQEALRIVLNHPTARYRISWTGGPDE